MSSPYFVFVVMVFTTDGKHTRHEYDLSSQPDATAFVLEELDYLKESLESPQGIYIGESESTLYNPRNIVRIEWTVDGGSAEAKVLRQKIIGLNIPRRQTGG